MFDIIPGDSDALFENRGVFHLNGDDDSWQSAIQYWDCRLYGGQQFARLVSAFKVVSGQLKFETVADDEVATALGSNLNVMHRNNMAWAVRSNLNTNTPTNTTINRLATWHNNLSKTLSCHWSRRSATVLRTS